MSKPSTTKPSMTKRMLIMLAIVLVLVAVIAGFKVMKIMTMIKSLPKPGPVTVTATKVEAVEWQPRLNAVGTLAPVRGVDVTTEIAGLVRSVNFRSGDEVKSGQVLIELNADADAAQLRALEAATELAASVLERDRAQLAIEATSKAQVDSDMADLKSKRALADQQRAVLAKKRIVAPFAGKLGITAINRGQYVNPGDKLVTLQTVDPIYVDFYLPQQQLASLAVGQVASLSNDAYPGVAFTGKINAISPKVDSATRNVQIEATIANPKRQLLPGMFANVGIDVGAKNKYLTLPQTAITYNPYGSTVFVAKASADKKDDKGNAVLEAQQVFVTTGPTRGDQVAILKGLDAGATVVTSGQLKLKNGTPLLIDNTVRPANDPDPKPQEH